MTNKKICSTYLLYMAFFYIYSRSYSLVILVTINIGIHFIWGYLPEVLFSLLLHPLRNNNWRGPCWSITKTFRYIPTPYA